jgi:hypothetical protein
MGVSVSIGYEGASWEEDKAHKPYDMRCPLLGTTNAHNFWIDNCIAKVVNKDIKTCYGGCKAAKAIPRVKAVIDAMPKDDEMAAERYVKNAERGHHKATAGTSFISQRERQIIIVDMLARVLVTKTMDKIDRGRTVISFYRKMYRTGLMNEKGEMING